MNSVKRVFAASNAELCGETRGICRKRRVGPSQDPLPPRGKVPPLDAPGGFSVDLAGHHQGFAPAPWPRSNVPVYPWGAHPAELQQPGSAPAPWGYEPGGIVVGTGQRAEEVELASELVGCWRAWRVLRSE